MTGYYFFLNRRNSGDGFAEAINSRFFVDKSLLIDAVNAKISTKEKWICISRPRRFGKTMNLEMLSAYYTKGINTEDLFQGLKITKSPGFYKHLNQHNVICINFNDYFDSGQTVSEGIALLSERLKKDLQQAYPDTIDPAEELPLCLDMVGQAKGEKFIFLVDEWDCVFRFRKGQKQEQEEFLGFLRALFKDRAYVELVYMTGILPIKKYNTGSALNMFREFTMLEPKKLASFFGFSEKEVKELCKKQGMIHLEELRLWYDGYDMPEDASIYNPRSVVEALEEGSCRDYWNKTGGFSELEEYITMNFDGLGDSVKKLVAGDRVEVSVIGFSNDLDSFQDRDEVITALIHLGYLTYKDGWAYIPNREIQEEFVNTVKKLSWGMVSRLLNQSRELLKATCNKDQDRVAELLEDTHDGLMEFKEYNSEQTLKCVIHLAYYAAVDDYDLQFEAPSGKGYADCLMVPRKSGLPGIVLELKYGRSPQEALKQIKERKYTKHLRDNCTQALLVGINYDKKNKKHECLIEEAGI